MKNNRTEQLTPCGVSQDTASEDFIKTIELLIKKYRNNYETFSKTVDELCAHGVGKGCYQNYEALLDVLEILTKFEAALKESKNLNG